MSDLHRYALDWSMRKMAPSITGEFARYEPWMDGAQAEIARLRDALGEISKGAGPFSHDPLTHARDCIECMKATAAAALWDAPDA